MVEFQGREYKGFVCQPYRTVDGERKYWQFEMVDVSKFPNGTDAYNVAVTVFDGDTESLLSMIDTGMNLVLNKVTDPYKPEAVGRVEIDDLLSVSAFLAVNAPEKLIQIQAITDRAEKVKALRAAAAEMV